jgi:MFS family permease
MADQESGTQETQPPQPQGSQQDGAGLDAGRPGGGQVRHRHSPSGTSGFRTKLKGLAWPKLQSNLSRHVRSLDVYGVRGTQHRYHKGLKHLWLFGFFLSCAGAFFGSYLPLYLLALGASRTQVGWLSSAASFFGMFGPIPGAIATRRWGKPRAMVVIFSAMRRFTLLFAALAPLFLSGQTLIYAVIGALGLRFAFIGLYSPALISLMGGVVPQHVRGRYLGKRKMAMAMASVVLVPLAGWMITQIGEPLGYQITLGIAFVMGLLGAYEIAKIPDSQVRSTVEAERGGGSLWEALRSNKLFRRYLLIRFFWNFVRQLGGPYFRVYQKEVLLSPTQLIGLLVTVSAVSRLVGQRFWGEVVDRKGAGWVLSVSSLLIPVLPFVWVFATEPWHVVFVSLPGGFLWAGFQMGALNLLLELPDAQHRTQSAAAHTTVIRVANMIAPLVGDVIIRQLGYRWDFAISGLGRLVAALLFILVLKPDLNFISDIKSLRSKLVTES